MIPNIFAAFVSVSIYTFAIYRSLYLERITISPKKAVDTKYFWISPDTKMIHN